MVLHCEDCFGRIREDRQQIIQQQKDRQRMMQERHLAGSERSKMMGSQNPTRKVVFLPIRRRPSNDAA